MNINCITGKRKPLCTKIIVPMREVNVHKRYGWCSVSLKNGKRKHQHHCISIQSIV